MLKRRGFIAGCITSAIWNSTANAQCAPIDLGIPNIKQDTPVWCWAAVAQQIIQWKTGQAPLQCALVGVAGNVPPQACCGGAPMCVTTGGLQHIQFLIQQFGFSPSFISPPSSPQAVYQTLSMGRAIIMAVQTSPVIGHVVVIRGMACIGANPVLFINDPASNMANPLPAFSQPVPFIQIAQYWQAAIVVG